MDKNPVLNGIRWTFVTSVLRRVITLILFYFIAKWLSRDDLGIFREYSIIIGFVSLTGILSLDFHYIIEITRKNSSLMALWQIAIITSVIGLVLLTASSGLIGTIYKSSVLEKLLRYTSVFFVIEILRRTVRAMSTTLLQFKEIAIAETLNVILYSILSLLILYFYKSIWIFVITFYLGNVAELLFLGMINRDAIKHTLKSLFKHSKIKILSLTLKYNRKFLTQATMVSALSQISSNAPILILGMIVRPELIGLYYFASQIIGIPVTMFTGAISQVFFPVFAGKTDHDISTMSSRYIRLVGLAGLPVLLLFSYIMSYGISWLFHGKWDDAIPFIMPLFVLFGTSLYCNPLSGIPFIKRKPDWELIWNITGVTIKISAMFIGLMYSYVTAVWSYAIASSVMQFAFYLMAMVLIKQRFVKSLKSLLFSLIPTIIILVIIFTVSHLQLFVSFAIVVACSAILFYLCNIISKGALVADLRYLINR